MKKSLSVLGAVALAAGVVGVANAKGPKLSVDVEAFCGYPYASYPEIQEDGSVAMFEVEGNVAIRMTDVSTGPAPNKVVGSLDVVCLAAVKEGRGKPDQVEFDSGDLPPEFGVQAFTCNLGLLPEGAYEWKAMVTASGGDLTRDRIDLCEEVPVY
jgi:hypothetical protein